jgi:glycosyltransferase involved in cell wall biosynthesis
MSLFWFSNCEGNQSFLRVAENLLPFLDYEIYSILEHPNPLFKESIYYLNDIQLNNGILTYDKYRTNNHHLNEITCRIKFIFLQALYFCKKKNIENMIVFTGLDESIWYNNIIKDIKRCGDDLLNKLSIIYYVPIDYTPLPKEIYELKPLITLLPFTNLESYVVSHAIDPVFRRLNYNHKKLVNIVNNKFCLNLDGTEIIILNANRNIPRKRIQLTVDSFNILNKSKYDKKLLLWLHSDNYDNIKNIPSDCIMTKNISSEDLNMVYNICQIGLQTSSGEGWSFTNCEHAICGGLQVVPNVLATGHHFADGRGILINGEKSDDIVESLQKAIMNLNNQNYFLRSVDYFSRYDWNTEAQKLQKILTK